LRTPLAAITGTFNTLRDKDAQLDEETHQSLLETAGEEADRLNRLVGNLLDMTRIEAGAMRIRMEPVDVQDLFGTALEQLGNRIGNHPISVEVAEELPLIPMDFVPMTRVLVNLIDNALMYSPPEAPIELRARKAGAFLEIEVADRGIGIPQEDLTRVFGKFYRVHRPGQVSGTGLGLSICKGIIEAHGGFIGAENRPGGGTIITLAVPMESDQTKVSELTIKMG
jgi:two-component system sensor histidine kinase KdpD